MWTFVPRGRGVNPTGFFATLRMTLPFSTPSKDDVAEFGFAQHLTNASTRPMTFLLPRSLRASLLVPLFAFTAAIATANTAVQPEPRDAGWVKRHEGFVETAKKGNVDVLFLGDSITDFWRRDQTDKQGGGKKVFDANFAQWRVANFGISGDRTQHVLWRLQHGELEGIHPNVIMLMIGTNNVGFERDKVTPRNTTDET